jgi:putative inorganic carbon (HCO3(-)) transporter
VSLPNTARTSASNQTTIGILAAGAVGLIWWLNPEPLLPLFIAVFFIAAVSAIRQPFWICLAFIVLSFFRLHEAFAFLYPLHLPFAIAVITIGAVIWHVIIAKSSTPYWASQLEWFLLFFCTASLGVFFAFDRTLASNYWIDVFSKIGLMTLAFAWLPRRPGEFIIAAKVFAATGALVACVGIYNKLNGIGLVESSRVTIGRELNSLLGDPNDLALVLLFPLSFCLSFAIHRCGGRMRVFGLATGLLVLLAIVFTQSRGGLIGVLAVLASSFAQKSRSKLAVILIALIIGAVLYQAMGLSARIGESGEDGGLDASAADRLEAWKVAVRMAVSRPFTGVGLANFASSFSSFGSLSSGETIVAHSTWFGVLGETGFAGFVAFVGMVFWTIRSVLRSHRVVTGLRLITQTADVELISAFSSGLLSGLAGFCAAGSFLTQGFTWPLYILVGLSAAFERVIVEQHLVGTSRKIRSHEFV